MNDRPSREHPDPPGPFECPIPIQRYPRILAAHGGGGRLMHQLIDGMFVAAFDNPALKRRHDGAILSVPSERIAMTTDSYVISPLFFPGGNIGSLAVHGTVNDLAMCGARPTALSAGFILEEGLEVETLWKIVQSMKHAADAAGVAIVTGDTKVVERGKGDGVFINTAGIGVIEHDLTIVPDGIQPGDEVLLSGDVGRHGIAIMAVREGLQFESPLDSDSASVAHIVARMLDAGVSVRCLRDLTRGGLATALIEISEQSGRHVHVVEDTIPVLPAVHGACEILGLDPLYVANEGRFIAVVPGSHAQRALEIMRGEAHGAGACRIGEVTGEERPLVTMQSRIGTRRVLDMLSGEQLPRIC